MTFSHEYEDKYDFDGHTLTLAVEAHGDVRMELEGQDYDGRRGSYETRIEGLEIIIRDGAGRDITSKIKLRHGYIYNKIELRVEDAMFEAFYESNSSRGIYG